MTFLFKGVVDVSFLEDISGHKILPVKMDSVPVYTIAYKTSAASLLFSDFVTLLWGTGLLTYWELQDYDLHKSAEVNAILSAEHDITDLHRLSVQHVAGSLLLLSIGTSVATIAFLIEKWISNWEFVTLFTF